jgi:hypothetical protein
LPELTRPSVRSLCGTSYLGSWRSGNAWSGKTLVAHVAADIDSVTWLFPQPDLAPGEVIERKMKAVLIQGLEPQTAGYLYLTNRNLVFMAGRGKPADKAAVMRLPRRRCVSVNGEPGLVSLGRSWKRMRIRLDDGPSVVFGVTGRDAIVDEFHQALRVSPAYGRIGASALAPGR